LSTTTSSATPKSLPYLWPALLFGSLLYPAAVLSLDRWAPARPPWSHLYWLVAAMAVYFLWTGLFTFAAWVGSGNRATGEEPRFGPIVPSEWRRRTGLAGTDRLLVLVSLLLAGLCLNQPKWFGWCAWSALVLLFFVLVVRVEKRPVYPGREIPELPASDAIGPLGETLLRSWDWTSLARAKPCRVQLRLRTAAFEQRGRDNPSRRGPISESDWPAICKELTESGGNDPEVTEVARQLLAFAREHRFNYFEEAQNTLQFAQCIPYRGDRESKGMEYFRYPLETLYENQGDCDCKAILAASIFRAMGLRSIVLLSADEQHAAVAVEGAPEFETGFFQHRGRNYYYCETTDDSFALTVGHVPDGTDLSRYTVRVEVEPSLLGA